MIQNMNVKGRQTKLLAAIAIIAMIACVFVAIMPSGVDGATRTVDSTEELSQALENAKAGDVIQIAAGTYGNDDSESGYTVYTVDEAVTITSSATTKPVIYGSFWVTAEGVTINNLNINPYGNVANPNDSTKKNGITFYGDEITVTNCEFTVRNAEDAFANGISIFPKTDNAADWTLTGNTFTGFYKDDATGKWTTTAIAVANNLQTDRFGSSTTIGNAGMTDEELISVVNANTFNDNAYALTNTDYNDNSATYILDDGFRCAEDYTTYILSGFTVDKGADSALNVKGTLYVYGSLNAGTINNTGIIYNAGTIAGNISGSGYVIDATTNDEASVAIDTGNNVEANTIKNLFDAGATEVTIESGAASLPSGFNGTIVIGENAGLIANNSNTPYVIGENSVLEIPSFGANSATFYFANSADANSPTVALKSFTGTDVTIRFGSIVIGGSGLSGTVDVDAGVELELTNAKTNDGSSTLAINLGNGSTLTMNDNVVIPQGSTMNVNMAPGAGAGATADANLSRNMTLSVNGGISLGQGVTMDVSDGMLTGNGTITVAAGATLVYTAGTIGNVQIANNGGTVTIENGFGIENTVRTDITLEGTDNYLANDITIEEGVTLTIGRNAALDLRGFDLTIKGTLVIERNGTIYSSVSGGTLVLTNTGAIQNNSGIIGSEYPITIANGMKTTGQGDSLTYDQTVTMQGVSGVSIQLVRTGSGETRTYDMYVSGDVSRISGVDVHTLKLKNVGINADMTIGSGVEFTIDGNTVVSKDVAFTHNGTFMTVNTGNDKSFVLSNGSSAVFNSPVSGTITANTGVVTTGNQEPTRQATFDLGGVKSDATHLNSGITGITISVDRVTYPNPEITGKSIVEQRAYVTGTLDFENSSTTTAAAARANAEFTGVIYVIDTLTVPEDVGITGTFDVSEAGTVVVSEPETSVTRAVTYTGASYILETTENNSTVETTYYTNFAAAMGQIASAQDYRVTVSGEFEISGTYELTGTQSIGYVQGARVTVADDGQITVGTDADIDDLALWEIQDASSSPRASDTGPQPPTRGQLTSTSTPSRPSMARPTPQPTPDSRSPSTTRSPERPSPSSVTPSTTETSSSRHRSQSMSTPRSPSPSSATSPSRRREPSYSTTAPTSWSVRPATGTTPSPSTVPSTPPTEETSARTLPPATSTSTPPEPSPSTQQQCSTASMSTLRTTSMTTKCSHPLPTPSLTHSRTV